MPRPCSLRPKSQRYKRFLFEHCVNAPQQVHGMWIAAPGTDDNLKMETAIMKLTFAVLVVLASALLTHAPARAHGDVTPQAVDTKELPALGADWRADNPYRAPPAQPKAVTVGSSAYNQNCARCHGLEAISGGIAPDLRKLDNDCATVKDAGKQAACIKEMDGYFIGKVRRGVSRNGAVYMPPFEGILQQEAVWAIKSYLETRREKPL
jgi:cytochrome c-550 PedF